MNKKFTLSEDLFDPKITHVYECGDEVGTITEKQTEDGMTWYEAKGKHFSKGVTLMHFDSALDCFDTNGTQRLKSINNIHQAKLEL
jgi:hypothetical protein